MKPKIRTEQEVLNSLLERARREIPDAEDERSYEMYSNAEIVVDGYLEAVAAGNPTLPDAQSIGWACLVLLLFTTELKRPDLEVIATLSNPSAGVSLFKMQPAIALIRQRAEAVMQRAEADVKAEAARDRSPQPDDVF